METLPHDTLNHAYLVVGQLVSWRLYPLLYLGKLKDKILLFWVWFFFVGCCFFSGYSCICQICPFSIPLYKFPNEVLLFSQSIKLIMCELSLR